MKDWQYCILRPSMKNKDVYTVFIYDRAESTPTMKEIPGARGLDAACRHLLKEGWQYTETQSDQQIWGYHLEFRRRMDA